MDCAQEIRGLSPRVKDYFALENAARSWWNTDGHARYDRQLEIVTRRIDVRDKHVLDVATGRGRFAIQYVKNGARKVTAIDISNGMLQVAQRNAHEAGVESQIEFLRADVEECALEPDSFDVVNCMEVYVHLPNPQRATDHLFRCLRPGGVFTANIDLPHTKRRYFHWVNEPVKSLRRELRSWPSVRYAYFKALPDPGRALCHRLFGWPQHPRASLDRVSTHSSRRLVSTDETIAALQKDPDLQLSRAEDAICRMQLKTLIAILKNAGFRMDKVVREARWYQLPYGYIVFATKPT